MARMNCFAFKHVQSQHDQIQITGVSSAVAGQQRCLQVQPNDVGCRAVGDNDNGREYESCRAVEVRASPDEARVVGFRSGLSMSFHV